MTAKSSSASHSSAMNRLLDQLSRLPGIGRRSAHRVAFYLLKASEEDVLALASAIRDFKTDLKICSQCSHVTDMDPCPICRDPGRDQTTVLVVEQPDDILHLETTGQYRGLYHVLMGRVNLLEGLDEGDLNLQPLILRVQHQGIKEVILGTQPTCQGDGTALLLAHKLEPLGVRVSRLARGLPVGSSLDSVSKAVLGDAIVGRQIVG